MVDWTKTSLLPWWVLLTVLMVVFGLPDKFWEPNVTEVIVFIIGLASTIGIGWVIIGRFRRWAWPFKIRYIIPSPYPTSNFPLHEAKIAVIGTGPFTRLVSVRPRTGTRFTRFDICFVKKSRCWYWPFRETAVNGPFPQVQLSDIRLYVPNRALEGASFQRKRVESSGGFSCWFREPLPLITTTNQLVFYIDGEAFNSWDGHFSFRSPVGEDREKAVRLKLIVRKPLIVRREDSESATEEPK